MWKECMPYRIGDIVYNCILGCNCKILGDSDNPIVTTKENIEVIYHGKETIVLIKTGNKKYYKGVANCYYQDTYDKETGFKIAYDRAREKQKTHDKFIEEYSTKLLTKDNFEQFQSALLNVEKYFIENKNNILSE